jgi:hypothetical protein
MTNAGAAGRAAPAPYYVVFDVDVRDAPRYGEYMAHVLPQMSIEARGRCHVAPGVRAGPGSDASSPQRPALSITSGRVRRMTWYQAMPTAVQARKT